MISRRTFLKGVLALSATGAAFGGYALAEPFRLRVVRYHVTPPGWPAGLRVKLAVLADLHVIEPWMGLLRVEQIVARTNALKPDACLLLGDYVPSAGMRKWARRVGGSVVKPDDWAAGLAKLDAPMGVHAVLGNHDWWEDDQVQIRQSGPTESGVALERAGITLHENTALRFAKGNDAFWIGGLGDQWAFYMVGDKPRRGFYRGVDDLPKLLDSVTDEAPVVLMAHEPDVFAQMGPLADRVALTVSGHTHGGQVAFMGFRPIVPSRYGSRYGYGHIVEDGRHLVVSGGLGCSGIPVRFGVPPEIVLIELGGGAGV
ncbi:MAG: metallophosphoesterase [Filomicrobium sp.]